MKEEPARERAEAPVLTDDRIRRCSGERPPEEGRDPSAAAVRSRIDMPAVNGAAARAGLAQPWRLNPLSFKSQPLRSVL